MAAGSNMLAGPVRACGGKLRQFRCPEGARIVAVPEPRSDVEHRGAMDKVDTCDGDDVAPDVQMADERETDRVGSAWWRHDRIHR
jgi:hypothetical protein